MIIANSLSHITSTGSHFSSQIICDDRESSIIRERGNCTKGYNYCFTYSYDELAHLSIHI